jgi:hypothetical protein
MSDDFSITYKTEFRGIKVIGRNIFPTLWTLKAEVIVTEEAGDNDVNLAFAKVDYFFDYIIGNSVFYFVDNKWADKAFRQSANNLVVCPFEPSEEWLTMVFQAKMNAISERGVHFGIVQMTSDTGGLEFTFGGDAVAYLPTAEEWLGPRRYFEHSWWMRPDATTRDVRPRNKDKIDQRPHWFVQFEFHEPAAPKKAEVIRPTFRPTVIDGTKKDD